MKRKTAKQVKAEAARLRALRPSVRPYSVFGDDHRGAIDAQVEVLEKGLSYDDIEDRWGIDADHECHHFYSHAIETRDWMVGRAVAAPSTNWKCLVQS